MQTNSENKNKLKELLGIAGMVLLGGLALMNDIAFPEVKFALNTMLACGFYYCILLADPNWAKRNGLKPKQVILIGVFVLILYLAGKDITARHCFILIGVFAAALIYTEHAFHKALSDQSEQISNIKYYLLNQKDDLSYKLEVEISPNWEAILKYIFKDEHLYNNLVEEQNLENLKNKNSDEDCLLGGSKYYSYFKFTNFGLGKSNLPMLWSSYHKSFRDDMVIMEKLFPDDGPLAKKLCSIMRPDSSLCLQPYFFITPYHIGFNKDIFYDPQENYEEMLSNIPFAEIMQLLFKIAKNEPGNEMNIIRKFPLDLREKLDKWGVKYSTLLPDHLRKDTGKNLQLYCKDFKTEAEKSGLVLSKNQTDFHAFETECFSVYIKMESHIEANNFSKINAD